MKTKETKPKKRRPLWKKVLTWTGVGVLGLVAVVMAIAILATDSPEKREAKAAATTATQEALIEAAKSGTVTEALDALEAGADPNLRDAAGDTLLHWVARNPDAGFFHLLIARADDPNARNNAGQTALHVAAEMDNPTAVSDLLSEKVNPCIRDGAGRTPYDIAKHKPKFNIEGLNKFALGRLKFADCD